MTDWLLQLLVANGLPLIALVTFFSCLAVPVPSSLAMLTAGAISASGDLPVAGAALAALGGAIAGDQTGYQIGRAGGAWIESRLTGRPKRAALYQRAQEMTRTSGSAGVFFSRWLVSPLGPYVNFAAGAARLRRVPFSVWAAAGEVVWVGLYVGLGFGFASQIETIAQIAQDMSGLLAGLVVMGVSALWIQRGLRRRRLRRRADGSAETGTEALPDTLGDAPRPEGN
ncbi:DedA family protein [Pseudooceanicola nanhaiensis]|uniref:DedA family protein n=1 Tax=Pseudooceanicola nanhaiensis TaxID=375761 RepID=UPI001CD34541|nr:VTT domain-containing protein [Pseudooceanicola nanhaiensis]MCA0920981.1 VTT domain-containing protein [Pseudooceanicola nanhaiensis]